VSDFQYAPVVAPVLTPAPVDAPQTCDRWKPTYPDRIIRTTLPPSAMPWQNAQPVFTPAAVDDPQTCDRWKPNFPDWIARRTLPAAAQLPYILDPTPLIPASIDGGSYIIPAGAYDLWQYLPEVGPLDVPSPQALETFGWHGSAPDRIARATSILAAQQQAWAMDRFDPPTPPTVPTNPSISTYPDKLNQRPPTVNAAPSFFFDSVYAPPQPDPRNINSHPIYPDKIWSTFREATYVWGQPMFGYEVDVPVESWTGWYLDPPVVPKRFPRGGIQLPSVIFVPDVTQPVPTWSWEPYYPDLIAGRLQISRGPSALAPIFVPDVTVFVPNTGVRSVYPSWIDRLKSLGSPAQAAFWMDTQWTAPIPPPVPALAMPVYPHRVYGRTVPTVHPDVWMPPFVLDVTLPSPILAWSPRYPDQIFRARYNNLYWEVEVAWFFQFPLSIFRPEWAVNANQFVGGQNPSPIVILG
jgi:hypothetical protein